MRVQVTQYFYPDGDRHTGFIELPDDPERQRKYDELTAAGCNMTGEVLRLRDYKVSTCISCDEAEDDFKILVTSHPHEGGPSGDEAVGLAIDQWNQEEFLVWKAARVQHEDEYWREAQNEIHAASEDQE